MGMLTRRNVKARAEKSAPVIAEKKVEKVVEKVPTLSEKLKASGLMKTEINRMSTAELKEVAKSFGVADVEEMSGNQIKKLLISAMGD